MAFLALSVDELALLRFTSDLTFLPESPFYFIEKERIAPKNMELSYESLIQKKVLDPETFRLTDFALNRIAPVLECDARIVHIAANSRGEVERKNFYLLDDIAVALVGGNDVFALGDDLDANELCEHFARRLMPRRALGERLHFRFTELEFVAFSRLVKNLCQGAKQLRITKGAAITLLGEPPSSMIKGGSAGNVRALPNLSSSLHCQPTQVVSPRSANSWKKAINGLIRKKVFMESKNSLYLRPALLDFVGRLRGAERHTFVRYEFGDGEWLMRESSFVPVDGGLFFIGTDVDEMTGESIVTLSDVDDKKLRWALESSLGPLANCDDEETLPFTKKLGVESSVAQFQL